MAIGRFLEGPNSLEGKWFADTLQGAEKHGERLYGSGNYHLVEANVPDDAPSLYRKDNMDGHGPARYLHLDDLHNVVPRLVTGS
jgi:hypothetical protein